MNKIKINKPIFIEDQFQRSFPTVLSEAINICLESVIKKTLNDEDYKILLLKNIENSK